MAPGEGDGSSNDSDAVVDQALRDYAVNFPDWCGYVEFHRRRYELLMALAVKLARSTQSGARAPHLLVIGPRFEVDLLHRRLPHARVDTVGLNTGLFPARGKERQVVFDLNDADLAEKRPTLGPYELIVMAEVIEHLHMAPSVVLSWLRSLLGPGGHLVVQTPNAVTLPHRLRMLAGRHPYAQLSADRSSPGHIREYTTRELASAGREACLEIVEMTTANYFSNGRFVNRLFQKVERLLPGSWRAGITVVYKAAA
jgi:trans-aconitate methyltransferase